MKKSLAILLILALMLPMCIVTNAAETTVTATGEKKPFIISNSVDIGVQSEHFYPKVTFWCTESYVTETSTKVTVPVVGGKTTTEIAANMKDYFADFPEGTRYIRDLSMRVTLETLVEDVIFMEKGVQVSKKFFTEFIKAYHDIGGELDGIAVDVEIHDGFAYYLTQAAKKDTTIYQRIMDNPNYATKIRPQLEERGFKFYDKITDTTPEIYSVDERSGDEYAQSRQIWNVVIRNYLNNCVNEIFMDLLADHYPNALLFDYQARDTYGWQKNMNNRGEVNEGGNYITAGHLNYFNTYSYAPAELFFVKSGQPLYKSVPAYNAAIYEDNAFNYMLWDLIHGKNYKASAPDDKFSVILCWDNYSEKGYCNTSYFAEMTYHMAMLDPYPLQTYCIESEILSRESDPEEVVEFLDEQIKELNRVAGYADRKHISTPYTWNDKYVLTGMYAGGRNIWRITPDTITTGVTKESFLVSDAKDPTFSVGGQTITFPGGKIIEDTKLSKLGTCGYWVETAKDVQPAITYSATRYEDFPAYEQNFDALDKNAKFDITKMDYNDCWEVKKGKNSNPQILDISGDNVLALDGTYSMKIKTLLANITAGDNYAKEQTWQVDVTVPADMAADAEIFLFDIYGETAVAVDGGVKIAGGKLYYTQGNEYVELTGVDVSKGGKFTVKRTVNFTKADAFTSTYAIYDAAGKLLGEAKNVAINTVNLPVEKIGLRVENVTGTAVYLDNFKLYASGLTADFELYNAKTGIEYTDIESAKDSNTAYRLSWLNATAYEKVYSIVAEYSDGTTKVIKEIKMAPGADFVDTGIVEVSEGQTVKLYARNDSQPEPEQNSNGNDNPTGSDKKQSSGDSLLIIVAVVGAVVLIGLIVVAVLIVFKKPAATEAKGEETEEKKEEPENKTEE